MTVSVMPFSARLSEPCLQAAPGGTVACELRLRNPGDSAVALRVVPRGRAGKWAVAQPDTVAVAPGGEASARLTFAVPDASFTAGETVAFTVRVVGERSLDVPGTIEIAERRDVRLSVHPLISQDGRHEVVVTNRGNVAALVTLGTEAGAALTSRVVVVEPEDEVRVGMVVAGGRRLLGRRPRPHRVAVWADQEQDRRLEAAAVYFQAPVRWKPLASIAAGLLLIVLAVTASTDRPQPTTEEVAASASEPVPSNCVPSADDAGLVPIEAFAYCPVTTTVTAGTEVRWRNDDNAAHSATAHDGGFDTGLLRQGQSAAVRFDRPGTYEYFCVLHPAMRGTVVVTA